ncbi:MAG: DUF928 domain-containing protein [Crocosphaera sp.]|nr:DUF928 domain-containing protein [Crocosphaera sp.]
MCQYPKKIAIYLSLFLSILLLIVFPLKANQQQIITDHSSQISYIALSWGDIFDSLRRKKGTGGSRGGNDTTCLIVPGKLKEREASNAQEDGNNFVWGENPLFLVQGNVNKIIVATRRFPKTEEEIMWTYTVPPSQNSDGLITHAIVYNGKSLQPNKTYYWTNLPSDEPIWVRFKTMDQATQETTSRELNALEATPQSEENVQEKIAKERVKYFVERKLWSDAIREMYNHPVIFSEDIKNLESHSFCDITSDT